MTIDYASAYANERIAHANSKRFQREAIHTRKAMRTTGGPIRARIGRQLMSIGQMLASALYQVSSHVPDVSRR